MGLGIAIAGSISVASLFMIMTIISGTTDKYVDTVDAKSTINAIEKKIDKTNLEVSALNGKSGSQMIRFSVTNTGIEKIWNYDKFKIFAEYDANIGGVKTRTVETLVYNKTASFPAPSPSQFGRPNQDISPQGWVVTPLYLKLDEVSHDDLDFVSETPSGGPTNTGLKIPSSTAAVTNGWDNPTNAYASDNAWATEFNDLDSQNWFNFNLGVPSGSTIDGIEVLVEGSKSLPLVPPDPGFNIELSWNSGTSYTTSGKGTSFSTDTDTVVTFGSSSDLWGRTSWSDSELSDTNFRVKLEKTGGGVTVVRVDQIQVRVYYTTPVVTSEAEIGLSALTEPNSNLGHILRFREDGKLNRDATVELLQGTSVIRSETFSSSSTFVTKEITLNPNEANSISDYSDLRVKWSFLDNGGSGDSEVSWIEFEIVGIPEFSGNEKQWGINAATIDIIDPTILNPGETFEFGGKLDYPIYPNGLLKIIVSTENGKVDDSLTVVS